MNKIIDLTLPIKKHHKFDLLKEQITSIDEGDDYNCSRISINSHSFTHIDAPYHFNSNSKYLEEYSLQEYSITEALVLDLSFLGDGDVIDSQMLLNSISGYSHKHYDTLLIMSDRNTKKSIDTKSFWDNPPFLSNCAIDWICDYKPKIIAFDFPQELNYVSKKNSMSNNSGEYRFHNRVLVDSGILVVEYITNLNKIGQSECTFIALPLNIMYADGAPIRCIAVV